MDPRLVSVVLTRNPNSPEVRRMKAAGAEVWGHIHFRSTWENLKKVYPENPWISMRDLYGKHPGATVFVCGSGPSLAACPPALPGPVFAINRAILAVKADYWCFADMKAVREWGEIEHAKNALWCTGSAMHCFFPKTRLCLIEANGQPSAEKDPAKRQLYWSVATFSWVTHLAMKTGAKRIVFVGCEFSGEKHFTGEDLGDRPGLGSPVILETARMRMEEMFGPDKTEWYDPSVELLDASGGNLPIPKTRLEEWL